ncbi:MAG: hypothetical protein RR275_00075 [Lachnospiraceae bacterium]
MGKKIILCFMVFSIVFVSVLPAVASDKMITFEGEADKFIVPENGRFMDGFTDMEPGQRKEQVIKLINNDYDELNFYLSGEVPDNIADKGNQEAIYDIDLSKDGTKFYQGIIGSKDDVGKTFLGQDFLLASLKKGESINVKVGISLDGDSAGVDYQNKQGLIKLNIRVEKLNKDAMVAKKVHGAGNPLQVIKTGDNFPLVLLLLAGISLSTAGTILVKKKREWRNK